MRRIVLDVGLLLSWFGPDADARRVRDEYAAGELAIVAPSGIVGDALALLARRPGWDEQRLQRAAIELTRLGFELGDPAPADLATWIARGLPPDRAAYAALAAGLDLPLATTDADLRRIGSELLGDDGAAEPAAAGPSRLQ